MHAAADPGRGPVSQHGSATSMSRPEVLDVLGELISACETEALRFHAYADIVGSVELCCLCTRRAVECMQAAHDLEAELLRLGGEAEGPRFDEQRGWTAMRGALGRYQREGLFGEGADSDFAALGCYRRALDRELPAEVRAVIERQSHRLQLTHEQMLHACQEEGGAQVP